MKDRENLVRRGFFMDKVFESSQSGLIESCVSYPNNQRNTVGGYVKNILSKLKEEKDKNLFQTWGLLENGGYIKDGKIIWPTYDTNQFGFRSDEWCHKNHFASSNGEKGAIFLGCSDVAGTGNYYENTAAYIVSKELGVNNYNLGYPGGGLDQCYRVLKYHITKINAEHVFLLVPESFRREIFSDTASVLLSTFALEDGITAEQLGVDTTALQKVYLEYMCDPTYVNLHTNKNLDAIEHLCNKSGMKLHIVKNPIYYKDKKERYTFKNMLSGLIESQIDMAADLEHFGKNFQKKIANLLLEKL